MIVTRRFEFDASHRLQRHEGKCRFLHGHHYVAEVTVSCSELDDLGRVIDFSVIKDTIGNWIDTFWDHNMILDEEDPLVRMMMEQKLFNDQRPAVLKGPPTAERMCQVLLENSTNLLKYYPVEIEKVRIYETPNCWAECLRDE